MPATLRTIKAGPLDIAYEESGPASGWPCILGHGFPYDVHAYSDTAPMLAEAGARIIGYHATKFGDPHEHRIFRAPATTAAGAAGGIGAGGHRRARDGERSRNKVKLAGVH